MAPMQEFVFWGVAYTLLSACTFDATGESAGDAEDATGKESGTSGATLDPTTPTGAPTAGSSSTTAGPSGGPDTGQPTTDASETSATTDPSETGDPPLVGCPEELPEGWILCEDFENVEDLYEHFVRWDSFTDGLGDRFRIDATQALSADSSLAVSYDQYMWWAGAAWIRFGAGPMQAPYAPRATFDEVWVRFHLRLDEGWDVGGMGDVIEVNSLTTGFAHLMSASVEAPPGVPTLRARARTCVSGGTTVNCDGMEDWMSMQELGNAPGTTPLFDGSGSGQWHCIVLHVRLNEPGVMDGAIDVSLDGELEAELDGLNLRGMRDDAGINAIHLSAYWDGGAPTDISRYIDDIVVSQSALDCE
jgi:hypothetical protein